MWVISDGKSCYSLTKPSMADKIRGKRTTAHPEHSTPQTARADDLELAVGAEQSVAIARRAPTKRANQGPWAGRKLRPALHRGSPSVMRHPACQDVYATCRLLARYVKLWHPRRPSY